MSTLDDDRLTLAGLLFEVHAGLANELERRLADECGLSVQWFEVLLRLARSPGHRLRMADLAAQVTLSASGLTRAVDRLVDSDLVKRERCDSDGRGTFAALTGAGLARIEAAVPVHLVDLDDLFIGLLDADERAQLEAILRKVRERVNPGAVAASSGCGDGRGEAASGAGQRTSQA